MFYIRGQFSRQEARERKVYSLSDCLALSSSFQNILYGVFVLVEVSSRAQRIVAGLLDTGAVPSLVNSSFLPLSCKAHVKLVKASLLESAINAAVQVQGILSVHVQPWFAIIENLAVDLLQGTSIIDSRTLGLFLTAHKAAPIHSHQVLIFMSSSKIVSVFKEHVGDENSRTNLKTSGIFSELCRSVPKVQFNFSNN